MNPVPPDPLSGQSLRYRTEGRGFVVPSPGANGQV